MYMEDLCTIKKTDDGKFVVQVMPPRKKEHEKGGKETMAMMEEPKTYVAADEGELINLIKEYVTSRMKKKTAEEKFEKGYKGK